MTRERRTELAPLLVERMQRMRLEGHSIEAISLELRVSSMTVRYGMRLIGLDPSYSALKQIRAELGLTSNRGPR